MPTPHGFVERLAELSASGVPFVCVTMVEAVGSTPQDAGSKMLVTNEGLVTGTVGGGRVEHKAIEHARQMLAQRAHQIAPTELVEWNLKRDVGMTCGGTVKLFFEAYNHCDWRIVVFGAGHVANAVVTCLGQLDCHVTCIDPRSEWLDRIPAHARLRKIRCDEPYSLVAELPDDAFVVCMTMGHATDRPILEEIFRQGRTFPFLGVIGSRAKRAVLLKELAAAGIPPENADKFRCPIGLDIGTNQPGEIAVSVVAQLIQERDRWRSGMSIVASSEPRIVSLNVTEDSICAQLADGRTVSVPLAWSWRLSDTTPEQRKNFEFIDNGGGVHWPDVDEDISVRGMLHGIPARPPIRA